MTIIHGENTIASRKKLVEVLEYLKSQGMEIVRQDAKDLTVANLEVLLGESDLFGNKKAIIIEGLHSLPKSQRQKDLIRMFSNSQKVDGENHFAPEIILWEKRELTTTMLKTFYGAQVLSFKASKTLFSWLDLLGKKEDESKKLRLLHEAIKSDGDFFCFVMLIRQFRLLIQAKSNEKIAGAPFMITKLKTQAQNFSLEQLQKIYEQLLKFDYSQKTSTNLLSLNQWLDLLTLKL